MSPCAVSSPPAAVSLKPMKAAAAHTCTTSTAAASPPPKKALFSTGNIARSTVHVGAHPSYSTAVELMSSIENTLRSHTVKSKNATATAAPLPLSAEPVVLIGAIAPVPEENIESRNELDVSATIFFTHNSNPDHVQTALSHALRLLKTHHLDSLTAHWTPSAQVFHSVREDFPLGEQDVLAGILPFWEALDECRRDQL
ncbi:hypothetical protein HDU67_001474, partial [Dinochytrium kinnereticum]